MNTHRASFAKFFRYSALLFALSLIYALVCNNAYVTRVIWAIVPFFFVAGLFSRRLVYLQFKKNPRSFSNVYMLLTLSRLMLYVMIMVVYSYFFRDDAYAFMITFFVFYAAFTVYEMIDFHKIMRS